MQGINVRIKSQEFIKLFVFKSRLYFSDYKKLLLIFSFRDFILSQFDEKTVEWRN